MRPTAPQHPLPRPSPGPHAATGAAPRSMLAIRLVIRSK